MADKKFTQLTAAGVLAANDLLAIAQSPFGAGSSKSITGANLATFINATVAPSLGNYLPLAGGTLVGNLLFTDNSFDIGATGATRLRSLFAATSLNVQRSSLGAVTADAGILSNTTAAALGAQQWSPAIRFQGFGWGTTAGTSQAVDWRIYSTAVQGLVPSTSLNFACSIAGAAFPAAASSQLAIFGDGALYTVSTINSGGGLVAAAGNVISFSGRARFSSPADGIFTMANTGYTDFTRLNFGGTTSSFPAIARSTTFLDHVLADASGPCGISCGQNAIGNTPTDSLIIKNTTAAANGAQQFSPAIRLQGFGWGTTAGTSQATDWRIYVTPIQGLVPTGSLLFDVSIAGAAFANQSSLSSAGLFRSV
jgi:hypothetical protein